MMCKEGLVSDAVAAQICEIRNKERVNMLDSVRVKSVASALGLREVVDLIESSLGVYTDFIVSGRDLIFDLKRNGLTNSLANSIRK